MKPKFYKNQMKKAFTLVELIIVIAVLAIIAIIAIPNFADVLDKANATNVKADTSAVSTAVKNYIENVGAVPIANKNAKKQTFNSPDGTNTYHGVTTRLFTNGASIKENELFVIDLEMLTTAKYSIKDKETRVPASLQTIPSTSAFIDVDDVGAGKITKKLKDTSVIYVIDKSLNVFAINSPSLTEANVAAGVIPTASLTEATLLNPSNGEEDKNHEIFGTTFKKLGATKVNTVVDIADAVKN